MIVTNTKAPLAIIPGTNAAHPIYVTNTKIDPEAGSIAEQKTATYTFDLTIATLLLFLATLLALAVGEFQRRAGKAETEPASQIQREHDRELQDELIAVQDRQRASDVLAKKADINRQHEAIVAQVTETFRAYERAIEFIRIAPQYPISSRANTLEVLFQKSVAPDVMDAIPVGIRSDVFRTVVKCQETLRGAAESQIIFDTETATLKRLAIIMRGYADRVRIANEQVNIALDRVAREADPRQLDTLRAELLYAERNLDALKGSPDRYDSAEYSATVEARTKKLSLIYPIIKANADDAKTDIVRTRRLLGDEYAINFETIDRPEPS